MSHGLSPAEFFAPTSARAPSSSLISPSPHTFMFTYQCRGVIDIASPGSACAFTSAPASSNNLTTSVAHLMPATCNGVSPASVRALTLAPAERRSRTAAASPSPAASIKRWSREDAPSRSMDPSAAQNAISAPEQSTNREGRKQHLDRLAITT
eukprot:CAMPEP_0198500870 /NCGR_PEP_ID=MMETSP1462-20131121/8392_1 /TAXON_ID=1333877 /ORGANISM="Brandtodinium nutriculum, Strain RCC3387" /LENGTH=152 /DNA_ID=CAMNT_0044229889 /DNA_START=72 /DNA_END=526 /DNA_ORIENTATION=+